MRIRNTLMSGLALASLFMAGLPGQVHAQGPPGPAQNVAVPNRDKLLISLDETKPTALLGGESVITGKVKNTGNSTQYNVGWSVLLPQGVDYLGAKAGPGEYGSPKATILLYGNGKTETVVHWANAADISPGEELAFEIRVKNSAPEGDAPPKDVDKQKFFTIDEDLELKAWAKGSSNATELPKFQEYGYANNYEQDASWAKDSQSVTIKGVESLIKIEDQHNGVTIRGNKMDQRQKVTVQLERTKYGTLGLDGPVSIDLDPVWEVMGQCVKPADNCFNPTENDLVWVNGKWKLNIPKDKFVFNSENQAEVSFEIAALDKDNVEPQPGQKKVNGAGLGGDGKVGGARDDVARKDPAYENNTGKDSQNVTVKIDGEGRARYQHPWNRTSATKYPNKQNLTVDLPEVSTRVEDTSVVLTTAMVQGGPYQNDKLATKKLVVRNNEYTELTDDRKIDITLSEPECPVAKDTEDCVENGTITLTRVVTPSEGAPITTEVQGTVRKGVDGKFVVSIPAAGIDPDTSRTQTFEFKSKVLSQANGKDVVNGKPLESEALLSWTDKGTKIEVTSKASLPPAPLDILNTVAFPASDDGSCPDPTLVMPTSEERKELKDQPENKRLAEELVGKDKWGKRRKVGADKDLCFQVTMKFPDGIITKDPKLNLFLPPEAELKGEPSAAIQMHGTLKANAQLDPSSNIATAKNPVDKPEKRTPLTYTFGQKVPGGSLLSVVYKATIKNTSVADLDKPEVLYDNLAKLGYTDFDGGFSNVRDLAGYEFISPVLMLAVDKTAIQNVNRGSSQTLRYTVTNIGESPVQAGTKVLFKLPEGATCADFVFSDGATLDSCVETSASATEPGLLDGGYAVATLTDPIGPKSDANTNDEKSFTLTYKVPNNHVPKMGYEIPAGIAGYKAQVSGSQPSLYIPRENALCRPALASLTGATPEEKNEDCAKKVAKTLFQIGTPAQELGKTLFVASNRTTDGKTTTVTSRIDTAMAQMRVNGTSTDANNGALVVVPGEKGNIEFTYVPNPTDAAATSPETLEGPAADAEWAFVATIEGVENVQNYVATVDDIKTAVANGFGAGSVDRNQVTVAFSDGKWVIKAPLKKVPGKQKTITLNNLFVATNANVVVKASVNHKALTLRHKNSTHSQLNVPTSNPKIVTPITPVHYTRKAPVVTVQKQVTNPVKNVVAGNTTVTYVVTVTNTSDVTAYNLDVTDTLPNGFEHAATLTSVGVAGGAQATLAQKLNWHLTESNKVGKWPGEHEKFALPAGASVTLTYNATVPGLVTSNQDYTNNVAVPFASLAADTAPGVLKETVQGSATVTGAPIASTTTITRQHDRHGLPGNAIQHGDVVTTTTTITIPGRVKVPNLSVLTNLTGAIVDRQAANVTVTCPPTSGLNCAGLPLLAGDPNALGVNLKNGDFENNSDAPIEVTVTVSDLVVTQGDGPVVAKGDAYTGAQAPNAVADFTSMAKTSNGSTGSVPIKVPVLGIEATLVDGANQTPITDPVEPGADVAAKITLTNGVADSKVHKAALAEVINKLAEKGLTPKNTFDQNTLSDLTLAGGSSQTIVIPLEWDKSKFTGSSKLENEQTVPVTAAGQTGPLNAVVGAQAPETAGSTVNGADDLTFTPLYPVPAVEAKITKMDDSTLSDQVPPVLRVGDEAKVTFTPTITGAKGYNPVLCVKAENIDGSVGKANALAALELLDPASGVELVTSGTACASGEIEVKLPDPGDNNQLPPVSFKVTSSGSPITEIMNTKITATLKVDSKIEKGENTPGPRSFTATTDQKVDVSPAVDIKVGATWLKPNGDPFGPNEPVVYNDFDTETNPIKAKITIQNIGKDAAKAANSTVKLNIPADWTVDMPADTQGWQCNVDNADPNVLTCTRTEDLPGQQDAPFEFHIQSLARLVQQSTPLTITGGHAEQRGAVSPFDHNKTNDVVNTEATVIIPKPDFAPTLTIRDPYIAPARQTKPFHVTVAHTGDPVRANEPRLILTANPGDTVNITNPNGWTCGQQNVSVTCHYPHPVDRDGALPMVEGTVRVANPNSRSTLMATTQWTRVYAPSIAFPDAVPANDTSSVDLKPFNTWVDGGIKVTFDKPGLKPDEETTGKITVEHKDGGADIPVGTKIQIVVPPTATVNDKPAKFTGCRDTNAGVDNAPHTWECDVVETIPPGTVVEGPTVTGIRGPNQKVEAKLEFADPSLDPNPSNNQSHATTRTPIVPGPVPPVSPTPVPDPDPTDVPKPEDRPTEIPPAPAPPAKPAPAKPGHTPTTKKPEERSNDWVDAVFPDNTKSRIVLIGRDNVFADSLSSGGLQGILDAPLLLNPVTHLADQTKAALDRLQPEEVIILGGPVAQSPAVEAELKQLGWNVSRVAGPTRVETAIDAATVHAPAATHGILARAYASDWGSGTQAFADALAGGALAARQQRPVFLTPTGELTDTLRDYLAKAKIKHLTVVGSTEAVSPEVEAELHKMGITTQRIAGSNRAETAIKVANSLGYWHAGEAESVLVVNGESEDAWTDAFPAALYAKRFELPVVLSGRDELLPETSKWLAPGGYRKPPTRVICGFSVGPVKQCAFNPAKVSDQNPDARPGQ